MNKPIRPIETWYAGCRFRSRLEARYAVFFDHIGARWEYEPQGFSINGRPYLPDFLLPECGVWIEVKGSEDDLDHTLMLEAAAVLPETTQSLWQPRLLLLGPIPDAPPKGDLAWLGLAPEEIDGEVMAFGDWWGFGEFPSSKRLARIDTSGATPDQWDGGEWLTPSTDADLSAPGVPAAYRAARAARFEHGERG